MDRRSIALFVSLLLSVLSSVSAVAVEYHVGPGQPLAAIGDVPWAGLAAGDRVMIHWRAAPYQEKWVINRQGTAAQPIRIEGVRGPGGERPVIQGDGAVTPAGLNFWNEERGVIKIGGSNTPPDGLPSYIVIEGLEIRSGRPPYTFTNDGGGTQAYVDNAAAIYVEKAEHLTIRDCVLHDAGNGLFIGAFDGQTQDILIEGNYFYDNGIVGSAFEHNTYTEALGITYQFNRFGPLRTGADGNNLKDRSAGLVVRYNWIESGNRQLDLVESDSAVLIADPRYRKTFVYGNVLIEPDGAGNSQIVHYGGDNGNAASYRKGNLYFFHNTLVSTRTGNTTLLRLSTQDETADVRNNILLVTAAGNRLAMMNADGTLDLSHNWTKAGWVGSHGTLTGTINDDGTGVTGTDPGFADLGTQDFALVPGADAEDAGGPLHAATLPDHLPVRHYVVHQGSVARPT
ncbi:MAG: polysaccharide-degrading enzyme, partial [Acidobacteria bacterium]|nr:polysaccharide-degrading enzyme [Acidobacteriota bacterium]